MEPRPFFTLGITGHINLPDGSEGILKERVREVLQWLRDGRVTSCDQFGKPLGLEETPLVLLSPLAPGADQLVAEVALEMGIEVRCPLPFPVHLYREASSFCEDPEKKEVRQAKFDSMLNQIGRENAFPVRHFDDPEPLTEDSDWKIHDEAFRNLRYRATGEFVAAHCDLLIAICNQENREDLPDKDPALTSRSFSGSRVITASYINGLRPGILPIPPSLSWQDSGPLIRIFCPNAREDLPYTKEIGEIEIWHPEDSKLHGDNPARIHKREMKELRDLASSIETLNKDLKTVSASSEKVAKRMPSNGKDEIKALFEFTDQVDQLADRNNRSARKLTVLSYVVGFIVFLCLALTEGGQYWYLPVALVLIAAGFITRTAIRRHFGIFKKREDYRAISEGMRVQAYWSAAGLRQSVASNYLQRLRGDISWIRSAIDSLIFPCDRFAEGYASLQGHSDRFQRLSSVANLWVEDQERYFSRGTYRKTRTKEVLYFLGVVFLIAGGSMVVMNVIIDSPSLSEYGRILELGLTEYGLKIWYVWLGIVLFFAALFSVSEGRFAASFKEKDPDLSYDLKVFSVFRHWSFRLCAGLLFGFLVYSMLHLSFDGEFEESMVRLGKAVLLALGGLWMGYANTIFASEDAKRYADMRGQFGAARRKIEFILQEYWEMIERGAPESELNHMQNGIRELYLTMGREALHEQMEWLLLRRNRPVEPVAKVK